MKKLFFFLFYLSLNLIYAQTATAPAGSGTSGDPYRIASLENLYWIAATDAVVSDPNQTTRWSSYYIQTEDINATSTNTWFSGAGWTPIGNYSIKFSGNYNGNGKTISGLYSNQPAAADGNSRAGMFGQTANATLSQISLRNVNLTVKLKTLVKVAYNTYMGALIGSASTTQISNCSATGTLTENNAASTSRYAGGLLGYSYDCDITYSFADCNILAYNVAGGLVGSCAPNSTYNYCFASGDITIAGNNTNSYAGGFCGTNSQAIINNSYATGATTNNAGGYASSFSSSANFTTLSNCYGNGLVYSSSASNAKGFIARNWSSFGIPYLVTITSCYFDTEATNQSSDAASGSGGVPATGKTTVEMKNQGTYSGWDFTDIWVLNSSTNNGYPYLIDNIPPTTLATWTGASNSNWNTAGNWDVNSVPASSDNVVIPNVANDPIIASGVGANCNNLAVDNGAILTIESGGSLINAGTITNNGTITVEKTITDGIWHLVSSPVSSATSNDFAGEFLQNWSETTANWSDITETDVELTPGKGFGLWGVAKTSTTYSITGTPNTGNVPIGISYTLVADFTRDGANLLGNPYPSSIDWTQVSGYGAVYYWDGAAYVAYPANTPNPGGGTYGTGSQYVPPMQGFFIVVPDGDPNSFTFTNAMRTHSGATSYYKSTKSLPDGIMIYADNGSYQDKLLIRLNDEATENMELECDAWKFPTNTQGLSQLWSICPDGNLSIDVRPETETIQMGFSNNQNGTYSIGISEIANINSAELEDTKLNQFHNLSNGAYTFDWNTADSEERFILHLKATGTADLEAQAAQVYAANQRVYIRMSELNSYSEMAVYDLRGRLIVKKILTSANHQSFELNQPSGAYLVQLIGESGTQSFKIVL